jgi:hypothetical protein
MARRRWSEWASARMLRALVREGARVHAAAGVHGLWHHLCSSLRVAGSEGVQKARSRAGFLHSSARFRALPHPG